VPFCDPRRTALNPMYILDLPSRTHRLSIPRHIDSCGICLRDVCPFVSSLLIVMNCRNSPKTATGKLRPGSLFAVYILAGAFMPRRESPLLMVIRRALTRSIRAAVRPSSLVMILCPTPNRSISTLGGATPRMHSEGIKRLTVVWAAGRRTSFVYVIH